MSKPTTLGQWLAGDKSDVPEKVAAKIWRAYFGKLASLAGSHLRGKRSLRDGEDVALTALNQLVDAVKRDKFPKLNDKNDLWAILVRLTANKAKQAVRSENQLKRGHGMEKADLDGIRSPEPDPAEAALFAESASEYLRILPEELRQIAIWKLECRTNIEIAELMDCVESTVERKLKLICERWRAWQASEVV